MNKNYLVLLAILFTDYKSIFAPRSIYREEDPEIGSISVSFEHQPTNIHHLKDYRLQEFPLFKTYNHEYLISKKIPKKINHRYEPQDFSHGEEIEAKFEKILKEINEGKKEFSDFKTLKKRDFNYFTKCGLLVLKFKDEKHPFIFKLFIEKPESFIKPGSKSFQTRGIFDLGGAFRHIVGYTRVRNIDLIEEKIQGHPEWSKKIKTLKKWFWIPKKDQWLIVKGYNLGGKKEQTIRIPAVYGLLCEEIKEDEKKDLNIKRDYLRFCSFMNYTLDPLPSNFKAGKNGEIILIDTEHFATLIGIRKEFKEYDKYPPYWAKIIGKYINDKFVTSKNERRSRQSNNHHLFPLY